MLKLPRDLLGSDLLSDVVRVLDVELVQRLDVLVHEGDRHQHQVLLAALHQSCEKFELWKISFAGKFLIRKNVECGGARNLMRS